MFDEKSDEFVPVQAGRNVDAVFSRDGPEFPSENEVHKPRDGSTRALRTRVCVGSAPTPPT